MHVANYYIHTYIPHVSRRNRAAKTLRLRLWVGYGLPALLAIIAAYAQAWG